MATPSNFEITTGRAPVESTEFNFSNLYLYHTPLGAKQNQATVIQPHAATGLGMTAVNNWTIYDGPGANAAVVARAQGLHLYAGNWQNYFSITFENQRFKGSTLQAMGISVEDGEWAIVGGTGQFAMANGVIQKKFHEQRSEGNIIQLTIHGFCPLLKGPRPTLLTKLGPWGGNGGLAIDIKEAEPPMRLESITVRTGVAVESIEFSYIDEAGEKRTAGPWGGAGRTPNKIQLASSEYLKEVSGTVGDYEGSKVITSIKFVTSVKTYGPFGQANGNPFSVPVQSNSSVVGFFVRSGVYLNAIGVYLRPL